ncbi:MAG: O-antigen ligase family protein [Alphaproteobacteria bacterium]
MTSLAIRGVRSRRLARAGLIVAAVGAVIAAANFFGSMLPVDLGLSPDIEPMIVVMHAGAAVLACGLLLVCVGRPAIVVPALRHPLTLAAFAVAAWSALLAPFVEFPLNSLLGSPSAGEGALMYAEVALFMAAAMILRRFRVGAWVAGIAVGVGAVVPALVAARVGRPEFFAEYVSFFAPASAALAVAACRRLPPWSGTALGLAAGLPALVLSNNNTVWVACAFGLFVAALFVRHGRDSSPVADGRSRRIAALLVPATLAAATLAAAFVGYQGFVKSLTARLYLDRIALEALQDRPLSFLIGQGWGRTSEMINVHFNASQAVLWDGSWDATLRRYADIHNVALEAVLAVGVPGLLGILVMMAMVPLYARRGLLPAAAGYMSALAALLAVWFQVPATVPLVALAAGWLVGPARVCGKLRRSLRARPVWRAVLLACVVASSAAAGWLAAYGLAIRHAYFAESAASDETLTCEHLPLDLDRGSFTLAQAFAGAYEVVFADESAGRPVNAAHMMRLERLLCAVGRAAAVSRSADLLITPVLFRGEIAFNPALPNTRDRFSDTFATWERAVDRFLTRAPRRTDMAWPYLSWRLERGDYAAVIAFSRRLLARDPSDPVGLWFAGILYTHSDRPAERREGFAMLHRSLNLGIERFTPVPPALRQEILRESSKT